MQPAQCQPEEAEEQALVAHYGPTAQRQAEFDLDENGLRYWLNATAVRKRRAEVALIVQRPDEHILLHTKSHHPPGTYRFPTGGVQEGESVLEALAREQWEELSARLPVVAMPGIVHYRFRYEKWTIPFASYLFLLQAGEDLTPRVKDASEAISGFRWVEPDEVQAVARQLRSVSHYWMGWGPFRAIPHQLFSETRKEQKP